MSPHLFERISEELSDKLEKLDLSGYRPEAKLVVAATRTLHVTMLDAALAIELGLPADMSRAQKFSVVMRLLTQAVAAAFGSILFRHMTVAAAPFGAATAAAAFTQSLVEIGENVANQPSSARH